MGKNTADGTVQTGRSDDGRFCRCLCLMGKVVRAEAVQGGKSINPDSVRLVGDNIAPRLRGGL